MKPRTLLLLALAAFALRGKSSSGSSSSGGGNSPTLPDVGDVSGVVQDWWSWAQDQFGTGSSSENTENA